MKHTLQLRDIRNVLWLGCFQKAGKNSCPVMFRQSLTLVGGGKCLWRDSATSEELQHLIAFVTEDASH